MYYSKGKSNYAKTDKRRKEVVKNLQSIVDRCPSPKKIGFYTIGDRHIYLYDLRREDKIFKALDSGTAFDFCMAVENLDALFEESITFPSVVASTAG